MSCGMVEEAKPPLNRNLNQGAGSGSRPPPHQKQTQVCRKEGLVSWDTNPASGVAGLSGPGQPAGLGWLGRPNQPSEGV